MAKNRHRNNDGLRALAASLALRNGAHESRYSLLGVNGKHDLSWYFSKENFGMFTIDEYMKMDHKEELFTVKLDNESLKGKRLYGEEFRIRPLDGAQRLDFLEVGRNKEGEGDGRSQYRLQLEWVLANCIIDEGRKCRLGPSIAARIVREDFDCAMALFDKVLELSGMIDKAEEEAIEDEAKNSDTTDSASSTEGSASGTGSTQG